MKMTKVLAASLLVATVGTPAMAGEKVSGADIAIPEAPEGTGQIVFFRPGGTGFALGCSVNENGEKISSLGAGRYFILRTTPGRHEFTVKSEAKDVLALEVEEGETQFAKCKIKMGIMVGRPDLSPAKEEEFRGMKSVKLVDADDMGPAPGALRPEEMGTAATAEAAAE
ncbi:DUF2846 domain-containing protein [Qipengyuania mesophila]|uniref:DUF2846 domain-containing protein n=1 Tax=Qipengyuania mesophila TaxID=2867246 RepID=UPI003517B7EA